MTLVKRHVLPLLREQLDVFPAVVIQGARQVGKSTLAQMLATERAAKMVTLDDPSILNAAKADPAAFLNQHDKNLFVIDEIQRAPELILPIKASIDRRRESGRFLLTGSSDLLRLQGAPDSLAGRAVSAALFGFSQGEVSESRDDFVGAVANGFGSDGYETSESRVESVERIVAGGYPEIQTLNPRMRERWFDGYLERILRRDAQDVRMRSNDVRLMKLTRLIAANQSGELVKARLGRDAAIPETSIPTSLDTLAALYLISELAPWTPNLTSREASRPKVALLDSGLAAHLTGSSVETLANPLHAERLGPLLEAFVVTELRKQQTWSDYSFKLFHWRDRDGKEVDIIAELTDGRVIAIEVKATSTARKDHFNSLRTLRDKLGDNFVAGFVIHLGEHSYSFGKKLRSMPLDAIWRAEA